MAVLESAISVFLNGTTQCATQQGSCDDKPAMQTARVATGMSELWELGGARKARSIALPPAWQVHFQPL